MSRPTKATCVAAGVGALTLATGALFKTACPTFFHDIALVSNVIKYRKAHAGLLLVDVLERQARSRPDKLVVVFEDAGYTYREFDGWCNRVARVFQELGFIRGDRVALVMQNEPAYLWTMIGLHKLGVVVTLINHNLRLQSLLHCIRVANCQAVFVDKDPDLLAAVDEIAVHLLAAKTRLFAYADTASSSSSFTRFEALARRIKGACDEALPVAVRATLKPEDKAIHIFTSGTTGLPKALIVTQDGLLASGFCSVLANIEETDVLYTPLPLYHASANAFFVSSLVKGCTYVMARKFNARSFWDDCHRHNVTAIQYIGETCRYLLAVPERDIDKQHHVRLAVGNGLRRDIWRQFKTRFNIRHIYEFYGASEGMILFFNTDNTEGACGKHSALMNAISPKKHYGIRYNIEEDAVVRGPNGFCVLASVGEPALYITVITEQIRFNGYEGSKENSESRILRNVFKTGDTYYNSGDLLKRDRLGNMYFVDRIGDTFRWKGENVSTLEVSSILCTVPEVQEAIVYGVTVPGHDGRAGMAALILQDGVSVSDAFMKLLHSHVSTQLPSYAQPVFLRFLKEAPITSTFKHSKGHLKKEGFDPHLAHEVYFKSAAAHAYVKMTDDVFHNIGQAIAHPHSQRGMQAKL